MVPGVTFTNALTVWLNGQGSIEHVINDTGDAVKAGRQLSYLCEFPTQQTLAEDSEAFGEPMETSFLQ